MKTAAAVICRGGHKSVTKASVFIEAAGHTGVV